MNGNVTWDVAYLIVFVCIGVLAAWWRIEWRIKESERQVNERLDKLSAYQDRMAATISTQNEARIDEMIVVSKDLQEYKLDASQRFASHGHLREVEVRLTGAIDRLSNRIEQLPNRFAEEVARIVVLKNSP